VKFSIVFCFFSFFLPVMKIATKAPRHQSLKKIKFLCVFVPLWQSFLSHPGEARIMIDCPEELTG